VKVDFEPAAREEVREAIHWYLIEAGQRQAEALSREIDGKVALLVQHPFIGTPGANKLRRVHLKVFPYTLHYRVEGEVIRVFAFAHQRRRPGYWRNR
jgi:plasmid stabilization system protein ParE